MTDDERAARDAHEEEGIRVMEALFDRFEAGHAALAEAEHARTQALEALDHLRAEAAETLAPWPARVAEAAGVGLIAPPPTPTPPTPTPPPAEDSGHTVD